MEVTLIQTAVLALAVGTVSLTITYASIFEWLRDWIDDRSDFLGELFSCPYCMSHWIALVPMVVYQPLVLDTGNYWPDMVVSWLALVALGSAVAGILVRIFGQSVG